MAENTQILQAVPKPYSISMFTNEIRHYDIYLSENVESPSEYHELFSIFDSASEMDTITLHINNFGGDLYTAIQLCGAIRSTEADVLVKVVGACMSAASIITLAADRWVIGSHAVFMVHAARGGLGGTISEVKAQSDFESRWIGGIMREYYKDFLSEEEILNVEKGLTIWLDSEQIGERLKALTEKRWPRQEEPEAVSRESLEKMTKKQLIDYIVGDDG